MKPARPLALCLAGIAAASLNGAQLKVACIGDSITEGSFLNNPIQESYPGKLSQLLGTNNYLVHNYGVSGRTLLKKGDFPYWKEAAYKQSLVWNPDIVTIMLGTNDSKPQNWRYGTNFVADYTDLITSYATLTNHPRILLCTPCPVFGTGAYDINPGIVATNILPAVQQLAHDLNLELIDVYTPMAAHKEWFPDNVHPNSKGTSVMAAIYRTALAGDDTAGVLPILSVSLIPGRALLSWPPAWGSWVAQSASTFGGSPTSWVVVEGIATNAGSTLRVGSPITGTNKYFRLWNPAL